MSIRLGSLSYERAFEFFYTYAGYSYNPKIETPMIGKERGADKLVIAEAWARDNGHTFEWERDHLDSSEWSDEEPFYEQWCCLMRDESGKVVQSLGGIDFGRESPQPWGKPYRRVVEAELALEQM